MKIYANFKLIDLNNFNGNLNLKKWQFTVGGCGTGVEAVEVVRLAEDTPFVQSELFTGAELASAGVAGETRQMVDVFPRPTYPIRRRYRPVTPSAFSAKRPLKKYYYNIL